MHHARSAEHGNYNCIVNSTICHDIAVSCIYMHTVLCSYCCLHYSTYLVIDVIEFCMSVAGHNCQHSWVAKHCSGMVLGLRCGVHANIPKLESLAGQKGSTILSSWPSSFWDCSQHLGQDAVTGSLTGKALTKVMVHT